MARQIGGVQQFLPVARPSFLCGFQADLDAFFDRRQFVFEQDFVVLDQVDAAEGLLDELVPELVHVQPDDGFENAHEQRAVVNAQQIANAPDAELRTGKAERYSSENPRRFSLIRPSIEILPKTVTSSAGMSLLKLTSG